MGKIMNKFKIGDKIIAIKDYPCDKWEKVYVKKDNILTIKKYNLDHNDEISYEFEEIFDKNYDGGWLQIEDYFILDENEMRKQKLKRILK